MEEGLRCHLCNVSLHNEMRRKNHVKNYWKPDTDPTRCDNVLLTQAPLPRRVPIIQVPVIPVLIAPEISMSRRPTFSWPRERALRSRYAVLPCQASILAGARNFTPIQDRWDNRLQQLSQLFDIRFWRLFLAMYKLSGVAIDSALKVVKKQFMASVKPRLFPISRRVLLEKMAQLEPFWSHVSHTVRIDMTQFSLPSGTTEICFKFIDPVWAWLVVARRQNALELHWKPMAQRRGHKIYGQGIHCGELFARACESVPQGGYPMCVGLHWDGTGAHGLSSSPICICVGNTNSSKSDTQFCIAYMPHVPDQAKPEWKKKDSATTVKWYIRQQCAAAILKVLEESAARGVKCRLPNQHGDEVIRMLYPRLTSMNFDQPEAQLFFGMQNKVSCSKCRRRRGRSAFKKRKRHDPANIDRLYTVANDESSEHKTLAREKLARWGFNYTRECCVTKVCDKLLVRRPTVDEIFPGVDYRDRMHGMFIFLHRMIYTALDDLVTTMAHRRILDRRLAEVCKRHFRREGKCVRSQKFIFTDVGMTAADKADLIFFLSHVLGPGPDEIIPARVYMPLATAVAQAQLILIAARGRRSYSKEEIQQIFGRGYVLLFGSLESVRQVSYELRLQKWAMGNTAKPPKRFKPMSRYRC